MTCSLLQAFSLDLFEEELVLLSEMGAEVLVQNLYDLGQRRLLVLGLTGALGINLLTCFSPGEPVLPLGLSFIGPLCDSIASSFRFVVSLFHAGRYIMEEIRQGKKLILSTNCS